MKAIYTIFLLLVLTGCGNNPLIPICGEDGMGCNAKGYTTSYDRITQIRTHDAATKYLRTK